MSSLPASNASTVWLSKSVSVQRYRELERRRNKQALSEFVKNRFSERYIAPLDVHRDKKSGFTIMAVACLMIETLESFYRGWPRTDGRSELAFCSFFSRWPQFAALRQHSNGFYKHVRCGVLHQAETTGGWRIWRRGPLFDERTTTINATIFLRALEAVLDAYAMKLRTEPWESDTWKCFRKKMTAICANAMGE